MLIGLSTCERKTIRRGNLVPAAAKRYAVGTQPPHSQQLENGSTRANTTSHEGESGPVTPKIAKTGGLNTGKTEPSNQEEQKDRGGGTRSRAGDSADTETPWPVPDIKEKASEIEKKILAFCLVPTKKVNKDQAATIMRHFKDMRGIVEELLLHNSYLTGRLEQSTGTAQNKSS